MANTTNIDLVKPAGTDHALVSVLNANSDKIDGEAGNVRSNFALVQNTNTATQAISKDQLVVWKGVLKKATSNIANGATLSSSNLTDTKVSTELAALSDQIASLITVNTNDNNTSIFKIKNLVFVRKMLLLESPMLPDSVQTTWTTDNAIIPEGYRPTDVAFCVVTKSNNAQWFTGSAMIKSDGKIEFTMTINGGGAPGWINIVGFYGI